MSDDNPLGQAISLLTRVKDKGVSAATLEAHFSAGLISDLFEVGDPSAVDRETFRRALGLAPLKEPTLILHEQGMIGATFVTVYNLGKRLAIAQMLRTLLKHADDAPLDLITGLLKARKYPIPKVHADEMLDKQAKFFRKENGGEDFGLHRDRAANLILVVDADGSLSVVYAYWDGSGWRRRGSSLDRGDGWSRESRLVVSNSDPRNL